jgi:hypothetical protein
MPHEKQPGSNKTNNSSRHQREPMRGCEDSDPKEPRASDANATEQHREGAARSCAERGSKAPDRQQQ